MKKARTAFFNILLADEHKDLFSLCLEDWSADAREAGPRRAQWSERFPKRVRRL